MKKNNKLNRLIHSEHNPFHGLNTFGVVSILVGLGMCLVHHKSTAGTLVLMLGVFFILKDADL